MAENLGKDHVVRAEFLNQHQYRIGGNTSKIFQDKAKSDGSNSNIQASDNGSALLNSTPPMITKALINLYPYLIILDKVLTILTWSSSDIWPSVLMCLVYLIFLLYLHPIVKYLGHIIIVTLLFGYCKLDKYINGAVSQRASLEDITIIMERVSLKFDLLLSPLTRLTLQDIERLMLTTILLSPIHILLISLLMSPQRYVLTIGIFALTYHSPWAKVTRRLLWKFKFIRKFVFYMTGLDMGGISTLRRASSALLIKKKVEETIENDDTDKPIKFTYVLYENQRKWLGIGWKPNMLGYERTSWTDEFLNEAPMPKDFQLPEEKTSMKWKWVDANWKLDLTNDGAIPVTGATKTNENPGIDDGFIYYDNGWNKPSAHESFSKYTRRRRWIRTAELVNDDTHKEGAPSNTEDISAVLSEEASEDTHYEPEVLTKVRNRSVASHHSK
ncbi:hypothetical protein KAFR_0A06650 [Kazachstania africana CBS 2517]|uniref:Peroxin/Ferlin domain-containing protein n=1 Tax=Kazachstania africana (strain ATCC 22294 / BCRC 22015 / CBS 2517 / CECT 1963 / NBRC 1671 / NRRL Y-8276) TaxID=1071382 RepID=H2AP00_KAZAF|nr:hypothetical protein KAFR_0A06650 [Kazachstania africana CBS 2517]CCF56100.1 hypothetical protein KAFR_0A06650 [Kazachstania africana CBS 2517]